MVLFDQGDEDLDGDYGWWVRYTIRGIKSEDGRRVQPRGFASEDQRRLLDERGEEEVGIITCFTSTLLRANPLFIHLVSGRNNITHSLPIWPP